MAEPRFADDDDLPRTLRRERDAREARARDAREREAREREMREREAASVDDAFDASPVQPYPAQPYGYDYTPSNIGGVTVTRLKLPFMHLMFFFMKAVVAAIPALILLTVLLWGMGQGLKAFMPGLRHFEIIVKSAT
ncbi:MAG: hypothetical protein AB7E81_01975 [Hyphomicrobiaceae bacterium]